MGDISIIARRLTDGHVQYGWSGNGGYYKIVGWRLLAWYNTPDLVEYLFGLGQLRFLGKPYSENSIDQSNWFYTTVQDGIPHELGTTEREIFSKIAFIDIGYLYDSDGKWYYVVPGPLRIKMPLELIDGHLDNNGHEFAYLKEIGHRIVQYMVTDYYDSDPEFQKYLSEHLKNANDFLHEMRNEGKQISVYHDIYKNYPQVLQYFDDWVLVCANDDKTDITDIIMMPKMKNREETIFWAK